MKSLFSAILLLFGFSLTAQIINIPDANFKNTLVNTNCVDINNNGVGDVDVDTDNDGEIQLSEALAVSSLVLSNRSIANVTGIENFINLQSLDIYNNPLGGELNVTMLTQLRFLNCGSCQLTALNVGGMSSLATLYTMQNNFTTLDLSTSGVRDFYVSGCALLEFLNIKNGITTYSCAILLDGPAVCGMYSGCPALVQICADEEEVQMMQNFPPTNFTNINSYCTFEPGGGFNRIAGTVTFDCGGSNTFINYQNVSVSNGSAVINQTSTATNGHYVLYSGSGNQTVSLALEAANYFTVTPSSYTYNFVGVGSNQTADFCLSANGIHPDLEVALIPVGRARPGFNAVYTIAYKNKGNQVQSGAVNLAFEDAVLDYVSSVPNVTVQSLNNLRWDFTDLMPFETRTIQVVLNVNSPQEIPPVNIGDILHFTADVSSPLTDETPNDNSMAFNQIVNGSFDPNDKTVVQGPEISLAQTGDYLDYVIRFQNTGTDVAENIVVKDILSDKLDWSTLQMVSSSHPFRNTVTGNKLEVFYQNINLPAVSVDEPGSHGYIAFKVKPKNTVALNDVIQNTASIYFDFNFPIVTNTVSTAVRALGVGSFNNTKLFTVYPNPTSGAINIVVANNEPITAVTINNLLGQTVMRFENTSTLDISAVTKGTYFVTVETDKGKETQKLIKL